MKELLTDAAERAIHYLESLPERPVAPAAAAVKALRGFDEPLPSGSCPPAETLRLLDELGSPATTAMAGPRFFGFVIGGTLPVTLAAVERGDHSEARKPGANHEAVPLPVSLLNA